MKAAKSLFILVPFFITSCASLFGHRADIRLVHYNIKELDTGKLTVPNEQMKAVTEVLKDQPFNILSVNEVQYDLPGVPDRDYKSKGKNIEKIIKQLRPSVANRWQHAFNQANTGNKAIKKRNGTYYVDPASKAARDHADQANFGIFPGQYSTGAAFDFKKKSELVVTHLKWKTFNPQIQLWKYSTAKGTPLPNDMQLFDKNFTDIVLDINGKDVHLILLHTVPAFHFGNKKTPNYVRNRDQLRFLEWYLTGSTNIKVNVPDVTPLPKDALWIAVGDWNTDIKSTTNPGSKVLKRLFSKTNLWMKEPGITHEADGFGRNRWNATLDYIAYSKGLRLIQGGIIKPDEARLFLGCDPSIPKKLNPDLPAHRHIVSYWDKQKNKTCFVSINKDFYNVKTASDHFALYADFSVE